MDEFMVAPRPIFDKYKEVKGYYLSYQIGNALTEVGKSIIIENSTESPFFEFINKIGLTALTGDKMVFVPVTNVLLATQLELSCEIDPSLIVLLLGSKINLTEANLHNIARLKQVGFKIAFRHYKDLTVLSSFYPYTDYIFCGNDTSEIMQALAESKSSGTFKIVASNIDSNSDFERAASFGVELFRGEFYKESTKVSEDNPVSPLKINCLQLLNQVNQDDFDLTKFASTVQKDTALALQFLQMVNSSSVRSSKIASLKHAAALLGQKEIKKWVTTAVTASMGQDSPSEIVRLSMLRAKFCENLAGVFEMGVHTDNLFLLGLFSVLDVILDMTMQKALHLVYVPEKVASALSGSEGDFSKVYSFVKSYEEADWTEISRTALMDNISIASISNAYQDALLWYSRIISITVSDAELQEELTMS